MQTRTLCCCARLWTSRCCIESDMFLRLLLQCKTWHHLPFYPVQTTKCGLLENSLCLSIIGIILRNSSRTTSLASRHTWWAKSGKRSKRCSTDRSLGSCSLSPSVENCSFDHRTYILTCWRADFTATAGQSETVAWRKTLGIICSGLESKEDGRDRRFQPCIAVAATLQDAQSLPSWLLHNHQLYTGQSSCGLLCSCCRSGTLLKANGVNGGCRRATSNSKIRPW